MSVDDREDPCSIDALTDTLCDRARVAAIADAALLEAVVAVADRDPAGFDADLVAFSLKWTHAAARSQVEFGRYLQRVIKPVWSAFCVGAIDVARARVFHDMLSAVDDQVAFDIALDLVDRAGQWTVTQLRDRLRRAIVRADPAGAAKRTARTVEQRRVVLTPDREATAGLFALCLPGARAAAAFERVDAYARAFRANGDARTLDQLRADTVLDLLEGVAIDEPPTHRRGVVEISIPWSSLASGLDGARPSGEPMDANAASDPATLAGVGPIEAPTAHEIVLAAVGRDDVRWRYRVDGARGELRQLGRLPTPRTASDVRVLGRRIAMASTAHAQPPVEADPRRRLPGPALSRWVRARDGTCRAPGCRKPASVCDIDHTVSHAAGGMTAADNLAVLCRHHHRLKHDGDWRLSQPTPGIVVWQSPHGPRFDRNCG
ncbi:MAG TPA: HNH endonuclease [Micromonosporaceae bacterium]|nr:HNH endonuclease [Micromonosporaceae bacterium]